VQNCFVVVIFWCLPGRNGVHREHASLEALLIASGDTNLLIDELLPLLRTPVPPLQHLCEPLITQSALINLIRDFISTEVWRVWTLCTCDVTVVNERVIGWLSQAVSSFMRIIGNVVFAGAAWVCACAGEQSFDRLLFVADRQDFVISRYVATRATRRWWVL